MPRWGVTTQTPCYININDLSQDLAMCTSDCYINKQCMKILCMLMTCRLALSSNSPQQMFDVCFTFSIRCAIMFNPMKSGCVVFKPKSIKIHFLTVSYILEYISYLKYVDFAFRLKVQDDDGMLRQMLILCI